MDILILGGTKFLGRHLVESAEKRGHNITLFNRGKSNPDLFPHLQTIKGDRTNLEDLNQLRQFKFDAVIDCCGYHPSAVRMSAELLKSVARHYVFVSSVSVYEDFSARQIAETAPTQSKANAKELQSDDPSTYGQRKFACEEVVRSIFPQRSTILRPGLIVGPWDTTWRFPYWIDRVLFGGVILSPGSPNDPVQFIDARDLADFTVLCMEERSFGTFNIAGPASSISLGELLFSIKEVVKSDCIFRWVGEEFLLNLDVQPWTHLPLWIPIKSQGIFRINDEKARRQGLVSRPIEETILSTKNWMVAQGRKGDGQYGLTKQRESELLEMWPT